MTDVKALSNIRISIMYKVLCVFYQSNKFLRLLHHKTFYHEAFLKSNNVIIIQKKINVSDPITKWEKYPKIKLLLPF